MRRAELEHILDAAASMEADIYPARDPAKAADIDGSLGDGSQFHVLHGYFAHGVGPETPKAPAGWEERLIRLEVEPRARRGPVRVGLCLEPHDLVLSKCAAGRDRDWHYARDAIKANLVEPGELLRRIDDMPIAETERDHSARCSAS